MQNFTYSYYTVRREEKHAYGRTRKKTTAPKKIRGGSAGYSGFIP
jgi:hypothetical protein